MLSVSGGLTLLFEKSMLCILFTSDSLQLLCFYMEKDGCDLSADSYLRDF